MDDFILGSLKPGVPSLLRLERFRNIGYDIEVRHFPDGRVSITLELMEDGYKALLGFKNERDAAQWNMGDTHVPHTFSESRTSTSVSLTPHHSSAILLETKIASKEPRRFIEV